MIDQSFNRSSNRIKSLLSRFGLYRKVLLLTLTISITPIVFFAVFSFVTLNRMNATVVDEFESVIDAKVRDAIELQASLTADRVASFLRSCEDDLRELQLLPRSAPAYLDFSMMHRRNIWVRTGSPDQPRDTHMMIPQYKELTFVDSEGHEQIHIVENRVISRSQLRDVSDPLNTTYLAETYFSETRKLGPGEIYVSHVNGFHMTPAEQLGTASNIGEAPGSPSYDGVIRFAAPIFHNAQFSGMVVLGLDHRVLMEFTQHILPNSAEQIVFPDYNSGNYAFMFDDRGWIITHPKYWDIPGVTRDGKQVRAYSKSSTPEEVAEGRIPFNLDSAGFVHENYPIVAQRVRNGQSGSVITTNIGGVRKVMAYAPIPYESGKYKRYGIFGGITIGAELTQFEEHSASVAASIAHTVLLFRNNIGVIVLFTFAMTAFASWLFSRNLARPIVRITRDSARLAAGDEVEPIESQRHDEIGVLGNTFRTMARELQKNRRTLIESFHDLKKSKEDIEGYSKSLEYQITILKSIQQISNILGGSTDMDTVLKFILRHCVESLKYDRAVLYLLDESSMHLEYREMHGFDISESDIKNRSRYDLQNHDCIETRVVRTGEICVVNGEHISLDGMPAERESGLFTKSHSFVYVPLKVKEKIIGILGADREASDSLISETDVNSLQILANQASRTIENTRLYQEILQQRNFVESIVEYMIKGVITIDTQGIVTSVNHAARKILLIPKSLMSCRKVEELFRSFPLLAREVAKAISSEQNSDLPHRDIRVEENGKFLTMSISIARGGPSMPPTYVVVLEDGTEKKQLDDHLQHLDRLASLGKFAAGIAHEIRNPLTGISVFLDDMHDKLSLQPEASAMLEMAISEIERLDVLVNELLDFTGRAVTKRTRRNINELVETTLRFTEQQCQKAGVIVSTQLDPDLPSLLIDSEKIRQALLNIILNAVQALPEGGRIVVVTEIVRKDESEFTISLPSRSGVTDWVRIRICDDGPGVPESAREHIFEPFFSRRQGGTGLGLSISQSIVTDHDGRLVVGRSEWNGAEFAIYLPVRRELDNVTGSDRERIENA